MARESLKTVTTEKKKISEKSPKEIFDKIGPAGVDAIQEALKGLDPDSKEAKSLYQTLVELREEERREAERRAKRANVKRASVEETWQALHEESSKPEEEGDEPLTNWAVEGEEAEEKKVPEEKKQNRIQKILESIKNLFK